MLGSRYLPWAILTAGGGFLVVLWATGTIGARGVSPSGSMQGPEQSGSRASDHLREKHFVTPRQLADSNAMVNRVVDGLSAIGHDGRRRGWDDLSGGQPVVLVFIKDGCPCSAEFEPFFRQVAKLYQGEVRFAGVIDAGTEAARRYATEQRVPYPVLADPERRIIRRLKAEHGGYVTLLTPGGVIDGFWPGCTAATMQELGRGIARLTGVGERPLNVSGMPGPLTTGCPFEFQVLREPQ